MRKKILIIDDEKEMCDEMSEMLADKGYHVTIELNSIQGKSLLEKHKYDILLLDIKMSGLSGLDILKDIRKKNINIKVIILTGMLLNFSITGEKTNCNIEKEILELADVIIQKPFNIAAMIKEIETPDKPLK